MSNETLFYGLIAVVFAGAIVGGAWRHSATLRSSVGCLGGCATIGAAGAVVLAAIGGVIYFISLFWHAGQVSP